MISSNYFVLLLFFNWKDSFQRLRESFSLLFFVSQIPNLHNIFFPLHDVIVLPSFHEKHQSVFILKPHSLEALFFSLILAIVTILLNDEMFPLNLHLYLIFTRDLFVFRNISRCLVRGVLSEMNITIFRKRKQLKGFKSDRIRPMRVKRRLFILCVLMKSGGFEQGLRTCFFQMSFPLETKILINLPWSQGTLLEPIDSNP